MLDAASLPVPADLPGRTLLPAAERRRLRRRVPSYFEAMSGMLNRGWAPLSGVLVDRDKFIELPLPERYDLRSDPAEATNLAGRDPARDRTLAALRDDFAAPAPVRAAGRERRRDRAAACARLRRGQRAFETAIHGGGRSETAHRTRRGRPPRRGGRRRGTRRGRRSHLSNDHHAATGHEHRVPPPRVSEGAATAISPARSECCAPRLRRGSAIAGC